MENKWNLKIMKLLYRYTHAIYSRYGLKTNRKQSIVFILSKADELMKLNGEQKVPKKLSII